MHRHGYQGRKFGRQRDQRRALMRSLAVALIERQSIETNLEKAKDLRPMVEKLITKARSGGLSDRRTIIAALGNNVKLGHQLVDKIAPVIKRASGYLRIVKLGKARVGDNAEMVRIEFVDLDAIKQALAASQPEKVIQPTTQPPAKASTKSDTKGAK
jgi:large subunit ribosomal protein L17